MLRVVLWKAGADLQHVGLPRLGNHHGVVQWSRYGALGLRLSLRGLLGLTLGLESGHERGGQDIRIRFTVKLLKPFTARNTSKYETVQV